jgi:hypothetical protein
MVPSIGIREADYKGPKMAKPVPQLLAILTQDCQLHHAALGNLDVAQPKPAALGRI